MINSPTILCLSLLLGLSFFGALDWSHRRTLRLKLRALAGGESPDSGGQDGWFAVLARTLPGSPDDALHAQLASAGFFQPEAAAIFAGLRLLGTAAAFASVLMLKGTQADCVLLALFAAFLCNRIFPVFLKIRIEARGRAVRAELAPVIDMLLMVLQSGVSIDQSLRHVSAMLQQTAPLTALVLKRYVADIDGGLPYEQAFERLGQRLGIEEGHDLATLIKQALLQGGEIMAPLERFGAEVTERRLATAREQVARRSIYLTIVMLGFFMPVLMIALAGPAVSSILDTLASAKQQVLHKDAKR